MDIGVESKIDLIVAVATKCADLLKDPTDGGSKDLSAENRTNIREEAYSHLIICINCLSDIASFNEDFYEIINISKKLKIDDEFKK